MTQEEKAKAYDEALERFKSFKEKYYTRDTNLGDVIFDKTGEMQKDFESIFPELRESEDERARKAALKGIEYLEREIGWDVIDDIDILDVKDYLEKQKELPFVKDVMLGYPGLYFYDGERMHFRGPTMEEKQKEQKPAEKQDYSGLNDLERAIHRGFLRVGVENVSITIIKETARECLAQMNPAEWNDTDMKEARASLISVCIDWERGQKTTLLPIAAVRARYFLEHLTEPKPAEWNEKDVPSREMILAIWELGNEWKERPVPEISQLKFIQNHWKESSYFDKIKSLRPQPHWKPSEEQISSLKQARDYYLSGRVKYVGRHLSEIAEQLEKLM